jgi:hypothetical protein
MSGTEAPERREADSATSRIGKLLYPMRVLGTGTCTLITYVSTVGTWTGYHVLFLFVALTYPHVTYVVNRALGASRNVELGVLLAAEILNVTEVAAALGPGDPPRSMATPTSWTAGSPSLPSRAISRAAAPSCTAPAASGAPRGRACRSRRSSHFSSSTGSC